MLALAIGAIGTVFGMGLIFAIYKYEAAQVAEELRRTEWYAKQEDWKALCKKRNALLTKAEDYSDRAYAEQNERWAKLAQSYLEQAEECENAMEIIEKMQDEIDSQMN